MSMLFVCGLAIPAMALNVKEQPNYYRTADGENIVYYLDNDGIPYIYENGKKETVLLPLEQFRITDPEECARLDAEFEAQKNISKANFESLVLSAKGLDVFYNGDISIPGDVWLQLWENTLSVVLKFSNAKPVFSNRNVNITFKYRKRHTHEWYSNYKANQNLFTHSTPYMVNGPEDDGLKLSFSPCGGLKGAHFYGYRRAV